MGVFDRQTATALRLIAKNGQLCTWQKAATSGGTVAKPAASVVTKHPVTICFLPLGLERVGTYETRVKDNDLSNGYIIGYMGRVGFEPSEKDTVLRDGMILGLADHNGIEKIDPNGEGTVLYILRFVR